VRRTARPRWSRIRKRDVGLEESVERGLNATFASDVCRRSLGHGPGTEVILASRCQRDVRGDDQDFVSLAVSPTLVVLTRRVYPTRTVRLASPDLQYWTGRRESNPCR